ncbi:hypothetical protein BKA70DRAFT_1251622 [Coprinopsis sp. MPI-PUGE-AT-0042]|nr:hypothetical protein BKA70DRAFT_1251622 [Coprinopsis sp. MPI-PUGE-AT-0042]
MSSRPPYYVFVALNNTSTSQPTSSTTLRHPRIQYHYADDSPLSLLPEHPDEHVLLLDAGISTATVHSISPELITTGLKIEDAPAASTVDATDGSRMYIIEAARDERTATPAHGLEERKPATAILAQFKARNQMIRRALQYPAVPSRGPYEEQRAVQNSTGSDSTSFSTS